MCQSYIRYLPNPHPGQRGGNFDSIFGGVGGVFSDPLFKLDGVE
jgi:hypothetical protein